MSREIKFRAYLLNELEMIDVTSIDFKAGLIFGTNKDFIRKYADLNDVALLQYTGNQDKNGTDVYENYVVADEYGRKYRVVFKGDCWRCEPVKKGYVKNRWISTDLEIIGNIYENPELLKEADNA